MRVRTRGFGKLELVRISKRGLKGLEVA